MITQVMITVEKIELKLLSKHPAADTYSILTLYTTLYLYKYSDLANEKARVQYCSVGSQ